LSTCPGIINLIGGRSDDSGGSIGGGNIGGGPFDCSILSA